MAITSTELARRIQLHPRVSLLSGQMDAQFKCSGSLSGFTPHYATQGCPILPFDEGGNPAKSHAGGVEIEAKLKETDSALHDLPARFNSGSSFLQLMVGSKYAAASDPECRFLKESGRIWSAIERSRKPIYVATAAILTPAGGYSTGRFYPLAIFSAEGETLWLNPEALEGLMTGVAFPPDQKVRSLKAGPRVMQQPTDDNSWYEPLRAALEDAFEGEELHERILTVRAKSLVRDGLAATIEEALRMAQESLEV